MPKAVQLILGLLGGVLVAVTPFVWFVKPQALFLLVPLILIWAAWLMFLYFQWAKQLGSTGQAHGARQPGQAGQTHNPSASK